MIVVQWEAQQTQNSKLRSALREMEARADAAEETGKLAGCVGGRGYSRRKEEREEETKWHNENECVSHDGEQPIQRYILLLTLS
jgi:hypothetical protein